jgi:aminoglycoside phosphotransferase (APT) family kinase protein
LLFDEGELFGLPALVLERLPGAPDVDPRDPSAWADAMGTALAAIHSVDLQSFDNLPMAQPRLPDAWFPAVGEHPLGRRAWDLLRDEPPGGSPAVLIHGDFQSTNVLWDGDRLTAVLDWTMVSRGDAGIDLGESRIDALLLFGPSGAEALLDAYERTREITVPDMAKWDLRGAMVLGMVVPLQSWADRYAALGRTDLTSDVLRDRLHAWMEQWLDADAIGTTS